MMSVICVGGEPMADDQPSHGAGRSGGQAALSFEQTVPRSLAHRAALSEVFVADSLQSGDGEFLVAVQVPRAHSLWFDRQAPYHDPLATAEAVRQSVFVVVHRYVGLSRELPFSLQRFEFRVRDLEAYRDNESSPLQGIVRLRVSQRERPRSGLGILTFEADLDVDGSIAMSSSGLAFFVTAAKYEAVRAHQRTHLPTALPSTAFEPLDPALVGRLDRRNVVIADPASSPSGPETGRYPLVVDKHHPSFFDHPYDHLPGPLIAEAWRQAAIDTANRTGLLSTAVVAITACSAEFSNFAELDELTECSASARGAFDDGRVAFTIGLHQLGRQIADGELELRPYP
jgi:hypothetical protein